MSRRLYLAVGELETSDRYHDLATSKQKILWDLSKRIKLGKDESGGRIGSVACHAMNRCSSSNQSSINPATTKEREMINIPIDMRTKGFSRICIVSPSSDCQAVFWKRRESWNVRQFFQGQGK